MVRIVLLRFMESYFLHRWLYLVPLVISISAGAVFVAISPPAYVANGRLYVEKDSLLASLTSTNSDGSMWITPAEKTTNEINELISSQAFTRSAIQRTDLERNMSAGTDVIEETFLYFRDALTITPQGDKLVKISATSEDPKLAQQMVVATMEAYVQWKLNSDFQESIAARNFFEAQIQPYKDEVDKARSELVDYINANPEPVRGDRPPQEQMEVERLQTAVQQSEDRLAAAQKNEESARLAQAQSESVTRQTYLVIDQPQMPTEATASMKDVIQNLAIFLAAGLFLSLAGIGAGALLDRSLRFPIDVHHGLSLPVLAMVKTGQSTGQLVTVNATTTQVSIASEDLKNADPSAFQPHL